MSARKLFHRRDALLLAALLALALSVHIISAKAALCGAFAAECEIWINGVSETVSLSEDRVFSFSRNPGVVFEVKGGAVAFVQSDCPDKTCVRTGFIRRPGHTAACLPNRTFIKIVVAGGSGGVDAVTK